MTIGLLLLALLGTDRVLQDQAVPPWKTDVAAARKEAGEAGRACILLVHSDAAAL